MNLVAIVQARLNSKRLPQKVLLPLAGIPVIAHVINRLKACKNINQIVLATSDKQSDNKLEDWAIENRINFYRGSLNDVLDRYYNAAKFFKAEAILRITADCPLIDPDTIDELIVRYKSTKLDAYVLSGEFPDGLDCQIFSFRAIEIAWRNAKLKSEREHVGPYIEKNTDIFKIGEYEKFQGLSHHRWTLDEIQDYKFLNILFDNLYPENEFFSVDEILDFLKNNKEFIKINNHIKRNEGYFKSIVNDKYIN